MTEIKVYLMCKETPVMELSGFLNISNLPKFTAKTGKILNEKLIPPSIYSPDNCVNQFNLWFEKRYFSSKRNFPQEIINWAHGKPHFFSLTDQYWLKYENTECWKDLNFFTNGYNEVFGDIVFSKNLSTIKNLSVSNETPDLTTNGILTKRWKKIEKDGVKKNILIKQTNLQYEQEAISELLASKYLKKENIVPFVNYQMFIEGFSLCCMCENFVTEETSFVPAWEIFCVLPKEENATTYDHLIKCIEHFNIPNAANFIDNMIVVDRQMMNFDRHLGNFGFLRNADTGDFVGPAPLFDFGNSFFSENANFDRYSKMFKEKEIKFLKNGRIKKTNIDFFSTELDKCSFLSNAEKEKMINNIKGNNFFIEKMREEKKKKKSYERENELQEATYLF